MEIRASSLNNINPESLGLKGDRRRNLRANCSLEVVTKINGAARDTVMINDLSEGGASLIIAPGTLVPNEFALQGLVDEGIVHCQIAWKFERLVGVKFIFQNPKRQSILNL